MEPYEYDTDSVYEDTASRASSQALPEEDIEEQPVDDVSPSRQSTGSRPLPEPPSQDSQPYGEPRDRARSRIPRPIAQVPSLRVVPNAGVESMPRSCMATSSASSSSRNVRFLLPEGHQDSFDDDMEEDTSPVTGSSYSQDVTKDTVNEDSEDNELEDLAGPSNVKPRSYDVDSSHVSTQHIAEQCDVADQHYVANQRAIEQHHAVEPHYVTDQRYLVGQDPVADIRYASNQGRDADDQHPGDNDQQPQPLSLSLRLGQEPPYPPPSFPPPAPPFPPRNSRNRRNVFPTVKSTASLGRDLEHSSSSRAQLLKTTQARPSTPTESPPRSTTESPETVFPLFGSSPPGPSVSTAPPRPSTSGRETVFPLFGSSPTESSGPRQPIYTLPNATHQSLRASAVDESEMPSVRTDPNGSPIYIGAPTGLLTERNASLSDSNPTQGPSDSSTNQQGGTEANRENSRGNGTPQDVVEATAELRRLAEEHFPQPSTAIHGGRRRAGAIVESESDDSLEVHHGSANDRTRIRASRRGTDRIRPSSVIAASTPSRVLTHEFIREMIQTELRQFQQDIDANRITRSGALSALSRASQQSALRLSELRSEAGMRLFVRHQARNNAAEERVLNDVLQAIANGDRVDQLEGALGDDPFYDPRRGHGYATGSTGPSHLPGNGFLSGLMSHAGPSAHHGHAHAHAHASAYVSAQAPLLPPLVPQVPLTLHPTPTPTGPGVAPQQVLQQPTENVSASESSQHSQQGGNTKAAPSRTAAPDNVVVRRAPGPFLYESADPEEIMRKKEEKREKRRERERERAQKKEEKAKKKAAEDAQKELHKAQSIQQSSSESNQHHGGKLKSMSSFPGSLRRAFQALKVKPPSFPPGPSPTEEDEEDKEEEQGQGRGHGPGHGHGHGRRGGQ